MSENTSLFETQLIGERVTLRLLTREDAPAYLDYLKRNAGFHEPYSPIRGDNYYTMETAMNLVDQVQRVTNDQQYTFGIFAKGTGQLIGKLNISNITRGAFQNGFFGYDMDEAQQGRGYMTEAVKLATGFALYGLGLHRLQASIMPRNIGSQKVVERVGFVREGFAENYLYIYGVWEDHFLYAITLERYEQLYGKRER
ncbi:GNAT family N-acetyltransferase [Brevibacillus dissolubilis]|uniref:GNAT family N-acetyltransferase n=1 Tax=Brevibacillus dissolubilis TaxID=1844116 RepID=UPI001115F66C|nr:GNAT family protein [Brevibacillus dissolubilis]